MKRKVILYITSFALCTIISLYSIKSMDVTGKETDVQEDIYLAQVTEDKESIKSTKPLKKAQLLEDASVETSAMAMWEYNGEKTFVSWLFNNKEEKEIVNYFNGIKLGDTVKDLDVSKLKDDMYGIRIGRKDGTFAGITWIDGYVFMENGDVYKADIDFKSIKKYTWQDRYESSLTSFPNMYYIAKNNGKWDKKFLDKSGKLKSCGIIINSCRLNGSKLEVKLKNTTKNELCYGEGFTLQARIGGKWYNIPAQREMAFNDIAHILKAGGITEMTYDLSSYGQLPAGEYRIVADGAFSVFLVE